MRRGAARRILVAGLALVVGLAVAEGIVRLLYPSLPSLAALEGSALSAPRAPGGRCSQGALEGSASPPAREAVELWVVGDSVAAGRGVAPPDSFASRLQRDVADATSRHVSLVSLAIPGSNGCQSAERAMGLLATGRRPDAIVFALFADDLEQRSTYAVDGHPVVLPSSAGEGWRTTLVTRSWLANLAWFAYVTRTQTAPPLSPDPAASAAYSGALRDLDARARAVGVAPLLALLAPAGLPRCTPDPTGQGLCARSWAGLAAQRFLLTEAGLPFLDLTHLWDDAPDVTQPSERSAGPTEVPIHPDAEGHRRIEAALREPVVQAVRARLGASPAARVTPR